MHRRSFAKIGVTLDYVLNELDPDDDQKREPQPLQERYTASRKCRTPLHACLLWRGPLT